MKISKSVRGIGAAAALLLFLSACASSSEVGSDVGAAGGGGGQGALRDPKATTTQPLDIDNPGTPTTVAQQSAGIGKERAVQATTTTRVQDETVNTQPATTTTTQADETFLVVIQDDEQGNFMQPLSLVAPVGAIITWKNVSASGKSRKVQASTGEFSSPTIPPGGTFSWIANAPAGTITYKDTTRPYATAQIQLT